MPANGRDPRWHFRWRDRKVVWLPPSRLGKRLVGRMHAGEIDFQSATLQNTKLVVGNKKSWAVPK
jgi:hypothetical protein